MGDSHPPPSAGRYKCLVIDPPWDQGKTGKRSVRPNQGTDLEYRTMTYREIASLPVGKWAAPSAYLWLWATNSRSRSSGEPILIHAFASEIIDTVALEPLRDYLDAQFRESIPDADISLPIGGR